jgi:hypothetical protein
VVAGSDEVYRPLKSKEIEVAAIDVPLNGRERWIKINLIYLYPHNAITDTFVFLFFHLMPKLISIKTRMSFKC